MSAEAPLPNRRPIDLNTAPADALSSVVGIGGVLAERIVAYRRDHGPFASLSQLTSVAGIGPGVLRRIGDQLTVDEGVPATSDVSRPPDQEPPEGGQAPVEPVEQEEPEQVAQPPVQEDEGGEPEPEAPESVEQAGEAIEPTPVEMEEAPAEPSPEEEALPEEERQPEAELPPPAAEAPPEPEEPEFVEAVIEAAEVVPTKVEEAAAEPGVEIEEPVTEKEAVEERVQVERPPGPKPVPFWHDLWLVLLGGLAGLALTVIATVIWSGTVDFAPRSEMQTLSGNLDTMQSNQEQAWERIDKLEARVGDLQKLTGRVSGLEDALDEAERELAEAQDRLVQTQDSVHKLKEALTSEIASLRSSVTDELERQGQRLDETEDALSELTASLKELEDAFELVEGRVGRFDAFFASVRDLLIDMQEPEQPAKAGPAAKPTATPIAKGK